MEFRGRRKDEGYEVPLDFNQKMLPAEKIIRRIPFLKTGDTKTPPEKALKNSPESACPPPPSQAASHQD